MNSTKVLLLLAVLLQVNARGSSILYRFDGILTAKNSAFSDISLAGYGIELGTTRVSYLFEVDFSRDRGSFSTSVQTVEYFHASLLGESVVYSLVGGISPREYRGYNIDFSNFQDTGQIRAGNFTTILTNDTVTTDWRVEDWKEGQSFRLIDGTAPQGGGPALYLYGEVQLTSITPIPEAGALSCVFIATFGFLAIRRRR